MTSYQAGVGFAKAKANLESLNRCTATTSPSAHFTLQKARSMASPAAADSRITRTYAP